MVKLKELISICDKSYAMKIFTEEKIYTIDLLFVDYCINEIPPEILDKYVDMFHIYNNSYISVHLN